MTALSDASLPAAAENGSRLRRARLARMGAPLLHWLEACVLPRWSTTGVDLASGGFFEKIDRFGAPVEEPRRARVVARQIYVFATAARRGWLPGADILVDHGLDFLLNRMRLPGGTFAAAVRPDGSPVRAGFDLYEHAFVLFALAAAYRDDRARGGLRMEAETVLGALRAGWGHPVAGFDEAAPRLLPLKSNPHMHLLEAALAWESISTGAAKTIWTALKDELVTLCLDRFIDARGALHEYFDGDWRPMPGPLGRVVEPGHQFEWAWLLMRCGSQLPENRTRLAAMRLLEIGERSGVDASRGVAVNELDQDFRVIDGAAKLWPQTERVKAWHLAALTAEQPFAADAENRLAAAIGGLSLYRLESPDGLWREQLELEGPSRIQECRASSLYHIVCAIDALTDAEASCACPAVGDSA